jgi:hypothetical protein
MHYYSFKSLMFVLICLFALVGAAPNAGNSLSPSMPRGEGRSYGGSGFGSDPKFGMPSGPIPPLFAAFADG